MQDLEELTQRVNYTEVEAHWVLVCRCLLAIAERLEMLQRHHPEGCRDYGCACWENGHQAGEEEPRRPLGR